MSMTSFYTSDWEQRKLDDWAFHVALQLFLGREFVAWANARGWCG